MTEPRRITDPEILKGLSHPLRQRLYRLLAQLGPATTTILAAHLDGADPGQVSYHLRELGKRGFIEEAPELARDRRERWWRLATGSWGWSSAELETPEGRAVGEATFAQMVNDQFDRLRHYNATQDDWPAEWHTATAASHSELRLTPEELRGLADELNAVIRKWAAPGRPDPSQRSDERPADGRENVLLFFHAFPERP